ncbi:MAG: hypothetical protein HDT44_11795 [Ruminococcaceae bacterium]|nr:hypothetical protein [Oscillospiraceae bacterium]
MAKTGGQQGNDFTPPDDMTPPDGNGDQGGVPDMGTPPDVNGNQGGAPDMGTPPDGNGGFSDGAPSDNGVMPPDNNGVHV